MRAWIRCASAALGLLVTSSAFAQGKSDSERDSRPARTESLKTRLGLGSAERWLTSQSSVERLRALERLGSDGSPRALASIAKALAPGGSLTSAEERLIAARVLAPYAGTSTGRQTLVRLMSGAGVTADDFDLERLARMTAALALANSGDREAITALARAVRHEGSVAETAALALAAHPPAELGAILGAAGRTTPTLVALLDGLADQRAQPALRELVRHGSEPIRASAAIALGRLGDPDTPELARFWLAHSDSPVLRRTAAELLALAHADDAGRVIGGLIAPAETRASGIELALRYPTPSVVPALLAHFGEFDETARASAIAVLGRTASTEAVARLAHELRGDDRDLAAYALASSPSPEATTAIAAALADPALDRDALRAATVRALTLGREPDGLHDAIARLSASHDAGDRAAAAWAAAALDEHRRLELIGSDDPVLVAAAARTGLDRSTARAAAEHLARTLSPDLRVALAVALADLDAASLVPTATLVELLETVPAAAPLAARALAARGGADQEARIEELITSGDPVIRAHAALGLGASADPSAIGRLSEAYRFEADALVRRAIVRALAQRPETSARRTLDLAARLDPDGDARRLATLALRGSAMPVMPLGDSTLWLSLRAASTEPTRIGGRAVAVVSPTGLALPFCSDPDGRLTVWGLPRGPVSLRLAPAAARGEALEPGPKPSRAPR